MDNGDIIIIGRSRFACEIKIKRVYNGMRARIPRAPLRIPTAKNTRYKYIRTITTIKYSKRYNKININFYNYLHSCVNNIIQKITLCVAPTI